VTWRDWPSTTLLKFLLTTYPYEWVISKCDNISSSSRFLTSLPSIALIFADQMHAKIKIMAQNLLQVRLKVGSVLSRVACIFSSVTSVILPPAVDGCIESSTTLAPIFVTLNIS